MHQTIFFFQNHRGYLKNYSNIRLVFRPTYVNAFFTQNPEYVNEIFGIFGKKNGIFLPAVCTRMEVKTVAQHNVNNNNRILHL